MVCKGGTIRHERPNLKKLAIGKNRWQPGTRRQINNKVTVVDVFPLIADDDSIHMFLCHRLKYAPIFSLLNRGFDWRADERHMQLLSSFPQRVRMRQFPYAT